MTLRLLTRACAALAVIAALATPGQAQRNSFTYSGITHTVYWLGAAWFPILTHVSTGDRIEFNNLTGYSVTVKANNGSWNAGSVSSYGSVTMNVTSGLSTSYYGYARSYYTGYAYLSYNDYDDEVDYTYTSSDLLQVD